MKSILLNLRLYLFLMVTTMVASLPSIAYARNLDQELGVMVLGGVFSVSVLSLMGGLLRTVHRLNDTEEEETFEQWRKEAFKNAFLGFVSGWIAYLSFAYTLPEPVVVLAVSAAGYAPALFVEKLNNFWKGEKN